MVLPDNQKLLARRSIEARANVAHAAVADIEAVNNGEAKGSRTLDYTAAHAAKINQWPLF